jgi:hypothetical protein
MLLSNWIEAARTTPRGRNSFHPGQDALHVRWYWSVTPPGDDVGSGLAGARPELVTEIVCCGREAFDAALMIAFFVGLYPLIHIGLSPP